MTLFGTFRGWLSSQEDDPGVSPVVSSASPVSQDIPVVSPVSQDIQDISPASPHRHRWILGEPENLLVHGKCAGCGELRDFPSSIDRIPVRYIAAAERSRINSERVRYLEELSHRMNLEV